LIVVVRDAEEKIIGFWQGGQGGDMADIFLMRIFGPFDAPF
jgi:hypothetical protein